MNASTFFRRSRKERIKERTNEAVGRHRKTMTVTQIVRGDVTKRRELYRVDLSLTKPPPWKKRRTNRAANRVARKSRRKNQIVRRGR